MPRIIRIAGIGVAAEKLLRPVTNEEFAARLAGREPELRSYWFNNKWFRTVGYRSDGVRWLREIYEPKFAEQHEGRRPDFSSDVDWGELWELVSAEVRALPRWIAKHTGIRSRLEALPEVATTDLMASAGESALKVSRLPRESIDGLFCASVSSDFLRTPTMAPLLQKKLRIPNRGPDGFLRNIAYLDGQAACCSFLDVLRAAVASLRSGECDKALVFGGDVMSRTTSPYSRSLASLLGDHAGAFVLVAEEGPAEEDAFPANCFFGFLDGNHEDLIKALAGGSRQPVTLQNVQCPFDQGHQMRMDGAAVAEVVKGLLLPGEDFQKGKDTLFVSAFRRAGYKVESNEDLAAVVATFGLIVFHQANGEMVKLQEKMLVERFGYRGAFHDNIERFANTTSAANLLCLYEAWVAGKLRKGMRFMVVAFGGGFTGMTCIGRWNMEDYDTLSRAA